MNSYNTLLVEQQQSRCLVTLNRPAVRNALSGEMIDELHDLLDRLEPDRSVRVVVVRGAGGFFCAGGDIRQFQEIFQGKLSAEEVAAENREIGRLLLRLNQLPQTVVMLVEGAAIGGGFGLVCVSDIAIATADTRFSLSETSLGIPPAQIAAFVVQRIGLTQARRLMLTAARFKADEAEKLGLVHLVVPDRAALEAVAEGVVRQVEQCGAGANAITKGILQTAVSHPLTTTLDLAAHEFAKAMLSDEGREGVAAFLEKRKPKWSEQG